MIVLRYHSLASPVTGISRSGSARRDAGGGYVVDCHLANCRRPLPADITLMDARNQGQPLRSCLAAGPWSNGRCITSGRDTTLAIGVGTAVDRVLDHPVINRRTGDLGSLPSPGYFGFGFTSVARLPGW